MKLKRLIASLAAFALPPKPVYARAPDARVKEAA